MDKNEIITLSSDEEIDSTNRIEGPPLINYPKTGYISELYLALFQNTPKTVKSGLKDSTESLKSCLEKFQHINVNNNKGVIIRSNKQGVQIVKLSKVPQKKPQIISKKCPEVVDLEGSEKSVEDDQDEFHCTDDDNKSPKNGENHSNLDIIDLDEILEGSNQSNDTKINESDVTKNSASKFNKVQEMIQTDTKGRIINECSQQNLTFFTEFVDFCGCLEEIPNDRARLTKKLMKRYGEADSNYVKSPEFRSIIQKCRDRVNKSNLYLIAKEITDELSYRKKIENNTGKSNLVEESCQRETVTEKDTEPSSRQSKKRTKVINKIIKKLDKLGYKIRELEEKEVDLSDEEESSYVQLQRYRERFCQIYTKLCKYTNELADADRIYNRKICFTESKYPAINKCIENWLNKTKRFPDFSDIMKLLENQSASLGLPSNRESIRVIAIEIFQQVGVMLQRRRKYDLWDSFCGFLDEGEDPATKDVLLDQVLKHNYEIRVKKEQEIFQHFAELQEKERLEPEEVPDDEANHSPIESGNEDEKEIEEIENSLNKRLDDEIKKDTEENENVLGNAELDEGKNDSIDTSVGDTVKSKESKNNYRNCKSLKWRLENGLKRKCERSANSEDSTEVEKGGQKEPENGVNGLTDEAESKYRSEIVEREANSMEAVCFDSPLKRKWDLDGEDVILKKRKCDDREDDGKELDVLEVDEETDLSGKKTSEVFQIHCCQIFADSVFEDLNEKRKDWGKRKVFRDLTNVSRLMEFHGRKKKISELFSPSFFYRNFLEFEKPSWKKRFKVSFKLVGSKGQKCALNQEEKSGKTVNPDNRGNEKNVQNNSEGAGDDDDGDNFLGGRGNGSEGDNNEDENKKNGKTGDEVNENQHEEDEDEEENEAEDKKEEAQSDEHSFPNQKTEEASGGNETCVKNGEGGTEVFVTSAETDGGFERENSDEKNEEDTGTEKASQRGKQNVDEIIELEKETPGENIEQKKENIEENEEEGKERPEPTEEDRKENSEDSEEPKIENAETSEELKIGNAETSEELKIGNAEASEELKIGNAGESTEPKKEGKEEETIKNAENKKKEDELPLSKETGECRVETEADDEPSNADREPVEAANSRMQDETETTKQEKEEPNLKAEVNDDATKNEECLVAETKSRKTKLRITKNKGDTKVEESSEVEKSQETKTNEMANEGADVTVESQSTNQNVTNVKYVNKRILAEEIKPTRNLRRKSSSKFENRTAFPAKENENLRAKRKVKEVTESKLTTFRKPIQVELPDQKLSRRNAPSTSDEERVKRFLLHSPSSISITPPRKLTLSKPPSQAAMQALATLRNLKGISATIVRGSKPRNPEDDVVIIGGSYNRRRTEQNSTPVKRRRTSGMPVISNVQTVDATTPKIVTVQGNVSGFDNSWPDLSNDGNSQSSSIRISNVWGSLPNTFMQSGSNSEAVTPGCSFRQNNPGSSTVKKKNAKKTVEYVVLD